jgi:hypothetical protein
MMRRAPGAGAWLLGLLTLTSARAETPEACRGADLGHVAGLEAAEAARVDDLINANGLMWRIEKPNLASSYLFGTIHSTDDSALEVARRAAELIKGAEIVATELGGPIDSLEKANVTAAMLAAALDRDNDTFEGVIPSDDREPVEKLLAGQGYPVESVHHLKPWFLAILTALPACEAKREALDLPEVDQFLAQTAKDAGVKVVGLETPREQFDAIETPGGRGDAAHSRRSRAKHERQSLRDYAATLPGEPTGGDPADFRRDWRIKRGRTFGAGSVHGRSACRPQRRHGGTRSAIARIRRRVHRRRRAASQWQGRSHRTVPRRWLHSDQSLVRLPIPRKGSRCS